MWRECNAGRVNMQYYRAQVGNCGMSTCAMLRRGQFSQMVGKVLFLRSLLKLEIFLVFGHVGNVHFEVKAFGPFLFKSTPLLLLEK